MVGTIQPSEYFPISRALANPADGAGLYVQAVVRNARTGATIATVNLAYLGGGLFATSWTAPTDSSGRGVFISITTLVYTDAAYTVLSDMYGQEQDTFLVYDRFKFVQGLANQISAISSPDIDYKKIKQIVVEELKPLIAWTKEATGKLDAIVDRGDYPAVPDLAPVLEALEALQKRPQFKATDLGAVTTALKAFGEQLGAFKMPDPIPVDLEPVLKAIADHDPFKSREEIQAIREAMQTIMQKLPVILRALGDFHGSAQELAGGVKDLTFAAAGANGRPLKEAKKPVGPVITRGGHVRVAGKP